MKFPRFKVHAVKNQQVGVKKEVAVSKRGSLILLMELIEELGFKVGDLFLARKTRTGISLKLL